MRNSSQPKSCKIIDLTGKRFGRWVALALHPERNRRGLARWVCRCDCGGERIVLGANLRSGATTSCRCLIDLTGKRFGHWTVVARHSERSHRFALWLCRCDCGNEGIVRGINLIGGLSKSCTCVRKELAARLAKLNTKHGLCCSRAYRCWKNMKARCAIRKALCRDGAGRALGPIGEALDIIAGRS
jgi:hypothetical protein